MKPAPTSPPHTPDVDPDPLLAFLADRNVGCPACEYNLRGLQSHICPECGVTLSLDTILAADPDFPHRRRRLVYAVAAVLAMGFLGAAAAGVFSPFGNSGFLAIPPLLALASCAATTVGLLWDNAIYNDRIRYPRARNLPSFRPIIHALTVLLYVELALDLLLCVLAVLH